MDLEDSRYDDYSAVLSGADRRHLYYFCLFISFTIFMTIHHILGPFVFRRFNKAYREFPRAKRMEWDSRTVSSIHATIVSVLCFSALFTDRKLWLYPITYPSHMGLLALSLSIGYFLCDLISMPLYWRGTQLLIFTLHHGAAALAFQQVVHYRLCTFFGVYRLTTELSTPFINQRWFYRTIGYTPDRRRVNFVTLLFVIFFALTRNLMIIPFWMTAYRAYHSVAYTSTKAAVMHIDIAFVMPCLILDCLNIYWAGKAYRIGWRSMKALWHADWRSDIHLAKARFHNRLRSLRNRSQSESAAVSTTVNNEYSTQACDFIFETSSSSNYSSESEYETADLNVQSKHNAQSKVNSCDSQTVNTDLSELSSDQAIIRRMH